MPGGIELAWFPGKKYSGYRAEGKDEAEAAG